MEILFLDANVLFSAAYRENAGLKKLWQLKKVKLVTSVYALEEARRNLKLPEQVERLDELLMPMQLIASTTILNVHEDIKLRDKDRPILAAAIKAKAQYLITGDHRDFGEYFEKKISGVTILTPAQYLARK